MRLFRTDTPTPGLLAPEGRLVPATVSGIPVERWVRTVSPAPAPARSSTYDWHTGCFSYLIMSDDTLKVREAQQAERKQEKREDFGELLAKVTPKTIPQPRIAGRHPVAGQALGLNKAALAQRPIGAQVSTALGSTENLTQARSKMNVEVSLLRDARVDGQTQAEQRVQGRVLEMIVRELAAEVPRSPDLHGPSQGQNPSRDDASRGGPAKEPSLHAAGEIGGRAPERPQEVDGQRQLKAQATVALVERIETFVKSQRPGIALTVGGGLDARVEVERTGRNEVALKVTGTRGPPSAEDLARIRDEMLARGLRLSSVSVG